RERDGGKSDREKDLCEFSSIIDDSCGDVKWSKEKIPVPYTYVVSPGFSIEALRRKDLIFIRSRRRISYYNRKTKVSLSLKIPTSPIHDHFDCGRMIQIFSFKPVYIFLTFPIVDILAHALMLKGALNMVMLPVMDDLVRALCKMAKNNPATPTTLGKEMAIFAARLSRQRHHLSKIAFQGKFAGATGNYNAHLVTYSELIWPEFLRKLFNAMKQFNVILMDFNKDVWGYIIKAGEVGCSTMPHKVNPIDFKNSKGNHGLASDGLSHLSTNLPISRWQVIWILIFFSVTLLIQLHSLLAYRSAHQGIGNLQVNEARLSEDLDQCWEVLAEPIQTVMRRYGVHEPYEKLKELTRGKGISIASIREFILA
ncbi:hypothetical protein MKX03_007279, partial [Papaver bracteatum]